MTLNYKTFKRTLGEDPTWVARAVEVICTDPELKKCLTLAEAIELMPFVLEIEKHGGQVPWALDSPNGKDLVKFVRRFAPSLYKMACDKAKANA